MCAHTSFSFSFLRIPMNLFLWLLFLRGEETNVKVARPFCPYCNKPNWAKKHFRLVIINTHMGRNYCCNRPNGESMGKACKNRHYFFALKLTQMEIMCRKCH